MDPARRSALNRIGVDRLLIGGSLALLCLSAWGYLFYLDSAMGRGDMALMGLGDRGGMSAALSDPMASMETGRAMAAVAWSPATAVLMFLMWSIMMVGMMIPSALPAILLFARIQRRYRSVIEAARYSGAFVSGYLLAWFAFSAVASFAQWMLGTLALMSPMTMTVEPKVGAGLFALAGIYQLSPLKNVCLRHCRSPAEFLAAHRRPGLSGALRTGAHHGIYCVGCCWMLMLLLFAGGVMNLLWVVALAIFVLLERLFPFGYWLARSGGVGMLAVAGYLFWNS